MGRKERALEIWSAPSAQPSFKALPRAQRRYRTCVFSLAAMAVAAFEPSQQGNKFKTAKKEIQPVDNEICRSYRVSCNMETVTMMHFPYVGSGPYCYSNSFAMMFGPNAPSTGTIEFATSSAFGMQMVGGTLPFFDPYGWTPEASFDDALAAIGWRSELTRSVDSRAAIESLRTALTEGPVWIGPVEMGHLSHQPGKAGPIGADHYLIVVEIDDESVLMHDPEGYPYSRLPLGQFLKAWRAETVDYGSPFTMRFGFRQIEQRSEDEIIQSAILAARKWLAMEAATEVPPGTIGNGKAAEALAEALERGMDDDLREHLIHFAVRVGSRRAADAATCMVKAGYDRAARTLDRQARIVGSLQYTLVAGDHATAADHLRSLAPTYEELLSDLEAL